MRKVLKYGGDQLVLNDIYSLKNVILENELSHMYAEQNIETNFMVALLQFMYLFKTCFLQINNFHLKWRFLKSEHFVATSIRHPVGETP